MSKLSEEEIIKQLKDGCILDNNCYEVDCLYEKDLEAIRSLFYLYQKEKEKNKLLIEGKFREVADKNSYIKDNYISKDKIREKIEEYNKMINATYGDMTHHGDVRRDNCIEIKNVLLEILEERN